VDQLNIVFSNPNIFILIFASHFRYIRDACFKIYIVTNLCLFILWSN